MVVASLGLDLSASHPTFSTSTGVMLTVAALDPNRKTIVVPSDFVDFNSNPLVIALDELGRHGATTLSLKKE
jgi:hypothetical protein